MNIPMFPDLMSTVQRQELDERLKPYFSEEKVICEACEDPDSSAARTFDTSDKCAFSVAARTANGFHH